MKTIIRKEEGQRWHKITTNKLMILYFMNPLALKNENRKSGFKTNVIIEQMDVWKVVKRANHDSKNQEDEEVKEDNNVNLIFHNDVNLIFHEDDNVNLIFHESFNFETLFWRDERVKSLYENQIEWRF